MWNATLDEAQATIKTARRNVNNLRYANDTTLMTESEEELKSTWMKVKEESEKVGLKLNIQKTEIMACGPIASCKYMGKQWKQWETIFLELSCRSRLYIFEISCLSVAAFAIIFSHPEGCLFTLLIVSFVVQNIN